MNNDKKFGVWMDNYHAAIVGPDEAHTDSIKIVAHVTGEQSTQSASEKNTNNQERMLQAKFFKEIASHLLNATHVHITGTGQAQEKFMHYLAETPQFKNTVTTECTSNKMSDERLVEFISEKFKKN
jgi:stalled ribosome rescue protein Dom34